MNKFVKVILTIVITLVILLGAAVFFLFNTVKSIANNPNLVQNPSTTVTTQQAVTTQAASSQDSSSSQDATSSAMDSTTTVSQTQAPTTPAINQEQAINAALAHAGLNAGNGTFTHAQLDQFDDNIPQLHYDVEIISNGFEYDYKIDAATGNVISNVKEIHD